MNLRTPVDRSDDGSLPLPTPHLPRSHFICEDVSTSLKNRWLFYKHNYTIITVLQKVNRHLLCDMYPFDPQEAVSFLGLNKHRLRKGKGGPYTPETGRHKLNQSP